jgi:hypothetical protein
VFTCAPNSHRTRSAQHSVHCTFKLPSEVLQANAVVCVLLLLLIQVAASSRPNPTVADNQLGAALTRIRCEPLLRVCSVAHSSPCERNCSSLRDLAVRGRHPLHGRLLFSQHAPNPHMCTTGVVAAAWACSGARRGPAGMRDFQGRRDVQQGRRVHLHDE